MDSGSFEERARALEERRRLKAEGEQGNGMRLDLIER